MTQERFCSQCGTARQEQAKFCVKCGHPFDNGHSAGSAKSTVVLFAGILLCSVLIYGGIYLLQSRTKQSVPTQASGNTEHTHTHPHDPHLEALQKKAVEGNAADAMALVGYLVEKGVDDEHYLIAAAEALEALLQKYPEFPLALRTLGNLYYDIGQLDKAEPPYRRYLELYPNDANYRTDYGTVLLSMGQIQAAIAEYKRAIGIFPDHYHATFNLSIAYEKAGETGLSQEYRNRAADIDRRKGKLLAPEIPLATLPDGEPQTPATKQAPSKSEDFGRYIDLAKYFRNHNIVGPKMTGFDVRDDVAVLSVSKFPMTAMPPFARDAFDKNVAREMEKIEGKAALEIRDSDSGALLATYPLAP